MTKKGERTARWEKGERFRIMYRVGGKKKAYGTTSDKREADRFKVEASDLETAGVTPSDRIDPRSITLGWIMERFKAQPVKVSKPSQPVAKGTVTQYVTMGKTICDILGHDLTLPELTDTATRRLPRLVSALEAKGTLGPRYINAHLKMIRTMYALGSHYGGHPVDLPAPRTSRYRLQEDPIELRALTIAEIRLIVDHAPDPFRAFIFLAGLTGLRESEVRGLHRSYVNLSRQTVRVKWQAADTSTEIIPPKTGKLAYRTVHFGKDIANELRRHLDAYAPWREKRPDLELVFPTRVGTVQSLANVTNRGWNAACRNAALHVLYSAAGDIDRAPILEVAETAKLAARKEGSKLGLKAGTIIIRGKRAYHDAQRDQLIARLDPEEPAIEQAHVFEAATFHHLRRSFATNHLRMFGDIGKTAALLGDTIQTAWGYIINIGDENEDRLDDAERLASDSVSGFFDLRVDEATAEAVVQVLEAQLEEAEATVRRQEGRVANLQGDVEQKTVHIEQLRELGDTVAALEAFNESTETHDTLTELLAALPAEVKEHPRVKPILNKRLAEEERERLEYERLRAKFGA